ncbi:AMP-binding protein [Streptomyces sp. NPDC050988]|uniref:AMP-binding protein n=1 Tax=Streptomyces sp. NPDC050988 TaxID=3365637 RepID=UPI003798D2CA
MYPGAYDPARPAVVTADGGRTLTYGQLEERSLRLADHLRTAGLRADDHLALLSDNDPRVLEVYWAAGRTSGRWPPPHPNPRPVSPVAPTCSTPPAPPATPRASHRRSPRVDALPCTPTGKLAKSSLRKAYWDREP